MRHRLAALAFTAASANPRKAGRWLGAVGAVSFILAPAVPLLVGPLVGEDAFAPLLSLKIWDGIMVNDGLRVMTGHGFNFVGSGFCAAICRLRRPHSILFETWTDLGLIGALAAAALTYLAYDLAARQSSRLAPFCLGALTYVTAMGVFGAATVQLWWITALALALAAFALAARGDFKTARPTAPDRIARNKSASSPLTRQRPSLQAAWSPGVRDDDRRRIPASLQAEATGRPFSSTTRSPSSLKNSPRCGGTIPAPVRTDGTGARPWG